MTSFWSQRSTYVPAIGERKRFGRVAATNTKATATGEWVTARTRNASAIWWTRSPNRLITPPAQSAEKDGLRARRTYGWRRSRSPTTTSGSWKVTAPSPPASSTVQTGARATAADEPGADRPVPRLPRTIRLVERRRLGQAGREAGRGADAPAQVGRLDPAADQGGPGQAAGVAARGPWRVLRLCLLGRAQNGGEQEEAQAGGQEQVADRGDVADERQRNRDDVADGPGVEEEVRVQRAVGEDHVELREDRAGIEAGGDEAGPPDRHVAAVHDDRDRVQQDADEREAQARLVAVDPEAAEQQPERRREERQTERLGERDAGVERPLGREADDDGEEEDTDPAQPDRGEIREVAAGEEARDEAGDDAADQHVSTRFAVTPESPRDQSPTRRSLAADLGRRRACPGQTRSTGAESERAAAWDIRFAA